MNILGILGLTTSITGLERLIAVYGNDFHVWDPALDIWLGQGIPVTSTTNKWRSAVFLDKAYFTNGWGFLGSAVVKNDDSKRYDGTSWRNETQVNKMPLSKYVYQLGDRLYIANLYFPTSQLNFPSMVWYCNLPESGEITWGFEEGVVSGVKGQRKLTAPVGSVYFKARGIKIGDPITFPTLSGKKEYNISEILNDKTVVLTEDLEDTLVNQPFWAGSNWFQVSQNDGDEVTGLGDNNDNLLAFKQDSLYRYDRSSLRKIKGVPGTTSQESVVNIKDKTYYFHPTGVWEHDGITSHLVSRPIQDYVDAVSPDMYPDVVAWPTGSSRETLRVLIGDVTDVDNGISLTNGILDFDTTNQAWSPGAMLTKFTCKTEFRESNDKNVFLGNTADEVYQDNTNTSDNGVVIPWMADTGFHFPAGPQVEIEFEKFLVYTKKGRGMQVRYKLYGTPWKIDKQWRPLNDIENEVTEYQLKGRSEYDNIGRGIAIQFTESSDDKTPVVERVDIFYKLTTQRGL